MNFHVDIDNGTCIAGWLIPDNPGDVPEFILKIPGRDEIRLAANVLRPDIRDFGWHATGMVGFHFDEMTAPDLPNLSQIAILEAETRLTIYKRFADDVSVKKKLVMLDAGGFPKFRTIRKVAEHFALSYPMVERFPIETIGAIIGNRAATSSVISGQVNWQRFGTLVKENDFLVTALLQDPFEELAERLVFISLVLKRKNISVNNIALIRYAPLFSVFEDTDLESPKSLLAAFRMLNPEQRRLIRSPMTHTFSCAPEEEPHRKSVSAAIDNLASMDVVGVRSHFPFYAGIVNSIVEAPLFGNYMLDEVPEVDELKNDLSNIGLVADLLDEDIALYSFVCEAVEATLATDGYQTGASARVGR